MKNVQFRAKVIIYLHTMECIRQNVCTGASCYCDFALRMGEEALILETADVSHLFGKLSMDMHIAFVAKHGLMGFFMNRMDRSIYMDVGDG